MPGAENNSNALRFTDKDELALYSFAQVLEDLNSAWQPHPGQAEVGMALFLHKMRIAVVQCGRKWGKTEFAVYCLWLYALTHPRAEIYYIAPQLKQAREILWDNFRLQTCNMSDKLDKIDHMNNLQKYVHSVNESQTRIRFTNGSFIKVDGSDNFNGHRGTKPDFIVYEEAAFMDSRFHVVMDPNLMVKMAPMLVITTPPEIENWYTDLVEEVKAAPDCFFKEGAWYENIHLPKAAAEVVKRKEVLSIQRGEYDKFQREYLGKFVLGGSNAIFPMMHAGRMRPHDEIIEEISRDRKKLQWFAIADPGYITCFAVLFGVFNPYTKQVYWLDCIYEKQMGKMSDNLMWPRMVEKMMLLYPNSTVPTRKQLDLEGGSDWTVISDENPASFRMNVLSMFGVSVFPSGKKPLKKEEGLSLIKDQILSGRITVSEKCEPLVTEMVRYRRDENGNIPKKGDHLIDCARYLNLAMRYTFQMTQEAREDQDPIDAMRNGRNLDDELRRSEANRTGVDTPEGWDATLYDGDDLYDIY